MSLTRREWLAAAAAAVAYRPFVQPLAAQNAAIGSAAARIGDVIRQFEEQGYHRAGTSVDAASADWLAEQVRSAGLTAAIEPWPLNRVNPVTSTLIAGDRRIDGLPLFDGGFTTEDGVSGTLGVPDASPEIALTQTAVNAARTGALGAVRRSNTFKAIVVVTRGRRPGLCPSNADDFLHPFGPPVLQVSSEDGEWLAAQAARGVQAQLVASVTRSQVSASNVTTIVEGREPSLPPLVVMTPRSGWYWCASERGGGIAAWLEIMRALRDARPRRSILFVASSGHEVGYLGIAAFIDRRPGIVKSAAGWLHLGANVGAAIEPSNTVQASDDEFDAMLTKAMESAGLAVTRHVARGTVPGGEAEAVHTGGGRYVSIIGGNGLFHNPDDRGPRAIDAATIAKFGAALTSVARSLTT
jgi:hypothetical protein